jgi:hypothetical protein
MEGGGQDNKKRQERTGHKSEDQMKLRLRIALLVLRIGSKNQKIVEAETFISSDVYFLFGLKT